MYQQGTAGNSTISQEEPKHDTNLSIEDEVQRLVEEISQKFVPVPSKEEVVIDMCEGMRRFAHSVRWKCFQRKEALKN